MNIEKILKDTIETSESVKASAEKMLSDLLSEGDRLGLLPEQYAREYSLSKWGKQLKEMYLGIYKLYDILRDLIPAFSENWAYIKGESRRRYDEEVKVDFYFENNLPIIKTPLLHRTLPENIFRKGYSNYFTKEIETYLYKEGFLPNESEDIIIYSLANYHAPYKARDNDNLQTKKIIDAITDFFPNKDSAFHCSFYSTAIVNTDLSEGVYFIVADKKDGLKTEKELQGIIAKNTKNETTKDTL